MQHTDREVTRGNKYKNNRPGKMWEDLQGQERWNLRVYHNSDHQVEFEGISVKCLEDTRFGDIVRALPNR